MEPPLVLSFDDEATPEIYTLSLHDALPISARMPGARRRPLHSPLRPGVRSRGHEDRKSTRLNSSHQIISYAVFCLKKKNYRLAPENRCDTSSPTRNSPIPISTHRRLHITAY